MGQSSSTSSSVGQTDSEGVGEGRCVHPRSGRDPVSFIDSSSGIHASKGKRRGEGGGGGSGGRRWRWNGTRGPLCFSLSLVSRRSLERRRLGARITLTSTRRGQRHLRPNPGLSPRFSITPDLFSTILVVSASTWPSRFLGTCFLSLDI